MRGVILAAGEGSRLGDYASSVPKAFVEVDGRTLYDRQLDALQGHVDDVTLVLGYCHENVVSEAGPADVVVFEHWADYDNAASLCLALADVDDDVLVLNGDVVVAEPVVAGIVAAFADAGDGWSVVGCLPGEQSEHTAIRADDDGTVTGYGMMRGRRHAGVGVLDRAHIDDAARVLRERADDWYPHVYTEVPTKAVPVPPRHHVEVNRPADLAAAERALPFGRGVSRSD